MSRRTRRRESTRMKNLKKSIAVAVVVVCAIVFFAGAISLAEIFMGYREADDFYGDLQDTVQAPSDTQDTPNAYQEYANELMALFESVKAEYPNVIGYISIPSVSIAYPVVQGNDNLYYTNHLISGEESTSGSIFLDCRVSSDAGEASNLVVYGHSMNNKSMFYRMRDLFLEDTFRAGWVDYVCESGVYRYAPFSVYVSTVDDTYYTYQFAEGESLTAFCEDRLNKSRFVAVDEYDEDSKLITLVTCSNSISNPDERYIYHAILTEYYPRTNKE